ncbi:MAG: HAD-IA family hydrolase, partial [Polyangiaceae bacterium]|nr:HAD-IA family hydrolase [Polyangiaceae bacterium]
DEQIARTARAVGSDPDHVREAVMTWMVRRPCRWLRRFRRNDLVLELEAFRRSGGKTALVSDYPASEKLQALDVAELFDVVIANGEPGGPNALKPSPDGFRIAADKLGVDQSRCLVVGDRDDADGEAARRAGMGFRLVR